MAELKTKPTDASVEAFVDSIPDERRRGDCRTLLAMMTEIGGEPRMWGTSIVGFGSYDYRYASGRTGTWFRAGFSPRKQALTLYLMTDLNEVADHLAALGRHKRGKGCLYVKQLSDVDLGVLREMIRVACSPDRQGSCGGQA